MRCQNNRGFTLIELVVVITIIGILLSIGIVEYSGIRNRTDTIVCKANRKTIENLRAYNYEKYSVYGNSLDDLELALIEIGFLSHSTKEDLVCPIDGSYTFIEDSPKVSCSIERHN